MISKDLHALPDDKHGKTVNSCVSLAVALKCLSLALHDDYLSNGRGHQQTRRILRDRSAKLKLNKILTSDWEERPNSSTLSMADVADPERRYLAEIAALPRLTSCEEYRLVSRMRRGGPESQKAHDDLIAANLGLVVMFAHRYQRPGLPLLDLIAEGNMGLMKAAVRFDPELGFRFATYAKWWIRQSIQLALPSLIGVVRIPVSHNIKDLRRPFSLAPDSEDTSDCSPRNILAVDDENLTYETSVDTSQTGTCEYPTNGDFASKTGDAETIAALSIAQESEPPGAAMAAQRTKVLQDALATLGERDKLIIAGRFSLADDHTCTLDELAQRFHVSIERIRQLESSALKKLAKAFNNAGVTAENLL